MRQLSGPLVPTRRLVESDSLKQVRKGLPRTDQLESVEVSKYGHHLLLAVGPHHGNRDLFIVQINYHGVAWQRPKCFYSTRYPKHDCQLIPSFRRPVP